MPLIKVLVRFLGRVLFTILISGLIGGALARYAPGFGVDERELDARLSKSAVERIRKGRSEGSRFLEFYGTLLRGMVRGDFGYSTTLNRPIGELLKERIPLTMKEIAVGLTAAGLLAGLLATATRTDQARPARVGLDLAGSLSLCLPVAILGYLCVLLRLPGSWALTVCVFPHLFRYAANLLDEATQSPSVLAARARGVGLIRIEAAYVLLPCLPDLVATFGMSVSFAFGALIPIEFATETPGLGQLAWQAASSRDLPLLSVLTMITAVLVLGGNFAGELLQMAVYPAGGSRELA